MLDDRAALERATMDELWSPEPALILADWLEEHGDDENAEWWRVVAANRAKFPSPEIRERLAAAHKRGKSAEFLRRWLSTWKLHHGVDRNWDFMWLEELR